MAQPTDNRNPPRIKAVLFDFMGTCLDWHTTITSAMPSTIPHSVKSQLALEWRQAYFDSNAARLAAGKPYEDIDTTHTHTLAALLASPPDSLALSPADAAALHSHFPPDVRARLIRAWHEQRAWADVTPALAQLREALPGADIVVHANGTTRLQLDCARAAGLRFDLLLSSELLGGVYKPDAESFRRALELLRARPEEAVMIACHAYDTRGAMAVGMRAVYVRRWSDDIREDQEVVRRKHEVYLEDGMERLAEVVKGLI